MSRWNTIRTALLIGAVLLVSWQFQRHARQARQFTELQTQIQSQASELASRKIVLDDLAQRTSSLDQQAATNTAVRTLVRQRATVTAATLAAREAEQAEKKRIFRNALADALDNPRQKEIQRNLLRNEIRAWISALAKKPNLTPEQEDQLIQLTIKHELQKTDRLAALLRGKVPVAETLAERNTAYRQLHSDLRSLLGEEDYRLITEDTQKMRNSQADRDLNLINQGLGDARMDAAQSDHLRNLLLAEFSNIDMKDETDAFRSPPEFRQYYFSMVEHIEQQAAAFLTPEQIAAFRKLATADLEETERNLAAKRKGFGL